MAAATRRRGAELDAAIFDAVLTELRDVGFADLTVEGVARRAGTSKAVLYRRWSTKLEMVITALANTRLADITPPDTGSLAGDLRGTILELLERLAAQGREVALGIMAGAASEPNPAAMTVLRTKAEDLSG
ncbi:TetR/AcrR family transcriptional regulator [Gordonia polyisoprenivorans]|uniref:TetR/AcrR family transcriptional regulator n=1 Tax=Gordonia polyisoprenivorans TaxID=84595 RepID=UPI0022FFCE2E|nr:helix-turn-helix domain-containing protein [Gordonia polyisoprenivorans]WCB38671.1 helix-turn-helix domain containing protein [Gordonia polyisoprenivorans]